MKKTNIISKVILFILICLTGIAASLLYFGIIHLNNPSSANYPIKGVDVSSHQGSIDWEEIADQDIDFAYIKATEGSNYEDSYFEENIKNAYAAGLDVGAYHFFSFESSGKKQAKNFCETVEPLEEMLPPVIDVEFYGSFKSEKDIDVNDIQYELRNMIDAIEAKYDCKPIIYTTNRAYKSILKGEFDDCNLWYRSVYTPIIGDVDWTFWQYSNRTCLKGYNGHEKYIDMNVFCGDKKDFKKLLKEYKISDDSLVEEPEEEDNTLQLEQYTLKHAAEYDDIIQETYPDYELQGVLYSYVVDLDDDGKKEAFVVDGDESGYDDSMWTANQMWFVDEEYNCQELDDLFDFGSIDIFVDQYGKTIGDNTYFVINGQVGAEGLGYVYTVIDNKLVKSSDSILSFGQKGFDGDDLVWYKEFYGMSMDNVDGKPDEYTAMGRCYVPYYLQLKDGKFELYSATELFEDEIKEYKGLKRDNYKDAVAIQYIYRDNNELDINYVMDDGQQFNFYADVYQVLEDGKTVEYKNTVDGYYALKPVENLGWDFLE